MNNTSLSALNGTLDAPVRILGIGGSVREHSNTASVLDVVLRMAATAGAETRVRTVRELDLPMYNEDIPLEDQPATLHQLLEDMQWADGFIVGSPTYHGSVPGALKNVFDALHIRRGADRTNFSGRPVGVFAFGGPSGQNVINALHHTIRGMGGLQVPTVAVVAKDSLDPAFTRIINQPIATRIDAMISDVIHQARMQRISRELQLAQRP